MTANQKKLFLNLCSFSSADGKEIEKNISKSMTPEVLGLLYANRMQTVAYKVIEKFGLFDLLGTEVKRALRNSYMSDLIINDSYMQCVDELSQVLTQFDKKYAALKGAVLCRNYPLGCRTSNDVDILVSSDDVSGLGNILAENGFVQGYVRAVSYTHLILSVLNCLSIQEQLCSELQYLLSSGKGLFHYFY